MFEASLFRLFLLCLSFFLFFCERERRHTKHTQRLILSSWWSGAHTDSLLTAAMFNRRSLEALGACSAAGAGETAATATATARATRCGTRRAAPSGDYAGQRQDGQLKSEKASPKKEGGAAAASFLAASSLSWNCSPTSISTTPLSRRLKLLEMASAALPFLARRPRTT